MTVAIATKDVAERLEKKYPDCVVESSETSILLKSDALIKAADFLKNTKDLKYDYLNYITAVDYYQYFEVVYQMTSLEYNRSIILKVRCHTRDNPTVPSLIGVYQGADFQEREIYDLMGITFKGHPNLKRIFLWEGFDGHPLRKDWNR